MESSKPIRPFSSVYISVVGIQSASAVTMAASDEPMDLLSRAWCSSALQVFQPSLHDVKDKQIVPFENQLQKTDMSLKVDAGDFKSTSEFNLEDMKSWIWMQKAIHPELDYDLCMRKKWLSKNFMPWKGLWIKKWLKKIKQLKKEEERLKRAEVHSAVSVAGVAAALAAIAAENMEASQHKSLKDTAVASAAALVAAQCAQVAEDAGAKREHLSSAIKDAVTATYAAEILTLTAAAATSLRGAATLRGRQDYREKTKGRPATLPCDESGFDFGMCRISLAKGDEMLVATENGKVRPRLASAILNKDGQVILRIKKLNALMDFSIAKESIIYDLDTDPLEEPKMEEDGTICICIQTSKGKIELKIYSYVQYKKWATTLNHMLMLSSTFSRQKVHLIGTNECYQNPGNC